MKTATLITHSHPPAATEAVPVAAAAAQGAGWRLVADQGELDKHGAAAAGIELERDGETPDICIVLGGDGTILHALRRFAGTRVPVFGVNFGTVGFLAAVERDDAGRGLTHAFEGEIETIELPAIRVATGGGRSGIGFNDVTLQRRPHDRVAELSYRVAADEVGHVRCDGLVAATPVGSTGYNLANQGPILAWGVKGYAVSYIAPHSLTARALVVAPHDVLTVGNAPEREPVEIAVDGNRFGELESGEDLEVSFVDSAGCLAQLPGTSFYGRIRDKFGHLAV